jgi:HEAT repeat protein
MFNKHLIILLAMAGVSLTSCAGSSASSKALLAADGTAHPTDGNNQADSVQVDTRIRNLKSDDKDEREIAKKEIIELSEKSPAYRQHVIKALMEIVTLSGGREELIRNPTRFLVWKESVDILGTIKATEAIDLLVDCLDCNSGASGLGPGRYPATVSVIKIGEEAVPKLAAALEGQSAGLRYMAVQALYSIGGDSARKALEKASLRERNKQLAYVIKSCLQDWSGAGKYKP